MKPTSSKRSIFNRAKSSCIAIVFSLIFVCAGSQTFVLGQKFPPAAPKTFASAELAAEALIALLAESGSPAVVRQAVDEFFGPRGIKVNTPGECVWWVRKDV